MYERVVFIDTDAFPVPDCPDLFDLVPEEALGAFNVKPYTDFHDDKLLDALKEHPGITWDNQYFNSGVMVLSRSSRGLFSFECGQVVAFVEQTQLNINRLYTGLPLHDIGYRFNHTGVPVIPKDDSWILHYPGPDMENKLRIMRKELNRRGLS